MVSRSSSGRVRSSSNTGSKRSSDLYSPAQAVRLAKPEPGKRSTSGPL